MGYLMMNVLLLRDEACAWLSLAEALTAAGYKVTELEPDMRLQDHVARLAPDAIIVATDSPSRDMLEQICVVSRDTPRPIVMFTEDGSNEGITRAIQAGVSAYVVDGCQPHRLAPILEVARARFEAEQGLKRELESAQTRLKERQLVDRAKGILMKQRGMDEESAYRALRKMAMDSNQRIGAVASHLIEAHQLLHG